MSLIQLPVSAFVLLVGLGSVAVSCHGQVGPEVRNAARFVPPVPAMVVAPKNIPLRYRNVIVHLRLTVDAAGRVEHVDLLRGNDPGLHRHLLPVVALWHFTPAMRDGRPVSAEAILPLKLIESADQ